MILKILVIEDAKSKYIGAHVVPVEGVDEDRYLGLLNASRASWALSLRYY